MINYFFSVNKMPPKKKTVVRKKAAPAASSSSETSSESSFDSSSSESETPSASRQEEFMKKWAQLMLDYNMNLSFEPLSLEQKKILQGVVGRVEKE